MHYRLDDAYQENQDQEERDLHNWLADELAKRGIDNTDVRWGESWGHEIRLWQNEYPAYIEIKMRNTKVGVCDERVVDMHDPNSLDKLVTILKHCCKPRKPGEDQCKTCPLF
jgi:hypothetical protein